jgi:aspartate aminotransferase
MALNVTDHFGNQALLEHTTPNDFAKGLEGSAILTIAAHVRRLQADGNTISNFTIGDFKPGVFGVPDVLREQIKHELDAGKTNYPPAVGVPELRQAVRAFYADRLGLDYPEGCVQVGSGARPPIYAAFRTILEPGDKLVFPVPTWNIRYYAYLNGAVPTPVETRPENGFMPTADDLRPHVADARMIVLNSPLNPCGTVIAEHLLREICEAIVAENRRREAIGDRPLILLYDQVYWQITFGDYAHHTPVGLVPEMAPYTIFIDAISKCWAATGLRVGWAVCPPWIRDKMKPLVGHMGAWAARPEQHATAAILAEPDRITPYNDSFQADVERRLNMLADGIQAMKAAGLPCDCLPAQGAIYLSARFHLHGHTINGTTIASDEDARIAILEQAGVAVVPFTAFGYRENTGWVRFSVGAVTDADVALALQRIEALLSSL